MTSRWVYLGHGSKCGYIGDRVFSVTNCKYQRKQESVDYASEGQHPGAPGGGVGGEKAGVLPKSWCPDGFLVHCMWVSGLGYPYLPFG